MGGGIIALIHPPNWRGYGRTNNASLTRLRTKLKKLDIHWLSMHDLDDGSRYFNAGTKFDMYVAENRDTKGFKTRVVDENKEEYERNLKKLDFIPNFDFDKVFRLIADENQEKVELLYSGSMYDPRRDWMSLVKSREYKHKCIWSISRKTGELKFRFSNVKKGHFGVPKVIFSTWHDPGIPHIDYRGEYGLTQNAAAIVDDTGNLPSIAKALNSNLFRKVMKSVQFTTHGWNCNIIGLFRRNFWEDFL